MKVLTQTKQTTEYNWTTFTYSKFHIYKYSSSTVINANDLTTILALFKYVTNHRVLYGTADPNIKQGQLLFSNSNYTTVIFDKLLNM